MMTAKIEDNNLKKTPIILDTDIGDDIDDTWALVMMLKSPHLDPKLILTAHRNTIYRAKIVAKLLTIANRTEIPIGIGINNSKRKIRGRQQEWVDDVVLDDYDGTLYKNGVEKFIDIIMKSEETIIVIAIGPLTNISKALKIEPKIASKCKLIGMHGAIYKGYSGVPNVIPEYNIKVDVKACKRVFSAPWISKTITPLDTCGIIQLKKERFFKLFDKQDQDPLLKALFETSQIWASHHILNGYTKKKPKTTFLFDTVAIYLAISEEYLDIKELRIQVKKSGNLKVTKKENKGNIIRCAINWKELDGFYDFLIKTLLNNN